ncbi:MAG: hypothetical protein AAF799_46370 [Myxococcota bacterium]
MPPDLHDAVAGERRDSEVDPTLHLVREADQLYIPVTCHGVTLNFGSDGSGSLSPTDGVRGTVVFHLGPQALLEEVVAEQVDGIATAEQPTRTCLSADSRIVVDLRPQQRGRETTGVPCTVAGLQSLLRRADMRTLPLATTGLPFASRRASPQQTELEVPWGLFVTPEDTTRRDCPDEVGTGSLEPVWQLRLTSSGDEGPAIRFHGSRDYDTDDNESNLDRTALPADSEDDDPEWIDATLSPLNRRHLVRRTSDRSGREGWPVSSAVPIELAELALSPHGAWLDVDRAFPSGVEGGIGLAHWRHRATAGRDHSIRILDEGYLFPLGHQAARLTVAERRVMLDAQHDNAGVAVLPERETILVRQPVRRFEADEHRHLPFVEIRLLDHQSPLLDQDADNAIGGSIGAHATWPTSGGDKVRFRVEAVDHRGRVHRFSIPLVFVTASALDPEEQDVRTNLDDLLSAYEAATEDRRVSRGGADLAFIPGSKEEPDDTTLATAWFDLSAFVDHEQALPRFNPRWTGASGRLPALEQVLGISDDVEIEPWDAPDGKSSDVFARLVGELPIEVPSEQTTGLATMAFTPSALARGAGPIADPEGWHTRTFRPAELIGDDLVIFGVLPLLELLPDELEISTDPPHDDTRAPRFRPNPGIIWTPEFDGWEGGGFAFRPLPASHDRRGKRNHRFAVLRDNTTGEQSVEVRFVEFEFDLGGALTFDFHDLGIIVSNTEGVEFCFTLEEVIYRSGLKWWNRLRHGSGLPVDFDFTVCVHDDHVLFEGCVSTPDLVMGALNLRNIRACLAVWLPIDPGPVGVRTRIASKANPFTATFGGFGAFGWLSYQAETDGATVFDAGIGLTWESPSWSSPIASGGLEMRAGLAWDIRDNPDAPDRCRVTGLVHIEGSFSLMGIAGASGSLDVEVGRDPGECQMWARGGIDVSVTFFLTFPLPTIPIDIDLPGKDPPFSEAVPEAAWLEQQAAFA